MHVLTCLEIIGLDPITLVYFINVPTLTIYPARVYIIWLTVPDISLIFFNNITSHLCIIYLMIFDILWLQIAISIMGHYVAYIYEISYKCICA